MAHTLRRLPRRKLEQLFPLTPSDLAQLRDCAMDVWNDIGFDVLQAMPHQTMKRRDVIEVVVDADRLRQRVVESSKSTPALKSLFPNLWDWNAASYRDLLLFDIFSFPTYGM